MRARVVKVDPRSPDLSAIREAAAVLRRGGLVAFPTETVYGLAANLEDPQAIQELYQVKQRPFEKKVTLHIADPSEIAQRGGLVTPLAEKLIEQFWPGPLTIVLRRSDGSTLGFRMPDHPVALALLKAAGVPVVAPSANRSGNPPPRTGEAVLKDLADSIDLLLDAGPSAVGVESTVVDLSGPTPAILRRGARAEQIEQVLLSEAGRK